MRRTVCPVLLGRDPELARVRRAYDGATRGDGAVLLVAGEAGVGKSRLVAEALEMTRGASGSGRVAVGRATPTSTNAAFRPFAEALIDATRGVAWAALPGVAPWLPVLEPLLSPTAGQSAPLVDDGRDLMRGEAVLTVLGALAQDSAVLVILEDLQWADPETLATLSYLADHLHGTRILVVATVRTDTDAGRAVMRALERRRGVEVVGLSPLSEADVAAMALACDPELGEERVAAVVSAADGVPFLVEELLASDGVPGSLRETIRARLDVMASGHRAVLEAAALLGRVIDLSLVAAATGTPYDVTQQAVRRAIELQLVTVASGSARFRHALTRDAVLDLMPRESRTGIAVDLLSRSRGAGAAAGTVADLALLAGRPDEAAAALLDAGEQAWRSGALATAAAVLEQSARLATEPGARHRAVELRIRALAVAGRTEECLEEGARLLRDPSLDPDGFARTELLLAEAAVEAARWPVVARRLDDAETRGVATESELGRRWALVAAELALSDRDLPAARHRAEAALGSASGPDVLCHAHCLIGRAARGLDDPDARVHFERAQAVAEAADLTLWRVRALHELGTLDLFDHAGTARLEEARGLAVGLGAAGLRAVLDVQLAAAFLFRFDLVRSEEHGRLAEQESAAIGLHQLRATAYAFLSEAAALRGDGSATERYAEQARAAAPADAEIEGSLRGGGGLSDLLAHDRDKARVGLEEAARLLDPLPNAGPGLYRGFRLLLAARDGLSWTDVRAAWPPGITVNRGNRGLLRLAEAVTAGRVAGAAEKADALVTEGVRDLAAFGLWSDLARLLVAEAARADGWGEPARWLDACAGSFQRAGFDALAAHCRTLRTGRPARWVAWGITPREGEVLTLVVDGLANREIAERLTVSHRTVEKHVESLLRKTGTRSRSQLVRLGVEA